MGTHTKIYFTSAQPNDEQCLEVFADSDNKQCWFYIFQDLAADIGGATSLALDRATLSELIDRLKEIEGEMKEAENG